MINGYVIRKYIAYLLLSLVPLMTFSMAFIYAGLNIWLCFGMVAVVFLILLILANLMLTHPMTQMIEGQGHLVMSDDSTGIIKLFCFDKIVPFIRGTINGEQINQAYSRDLVYQLTKPIKCSNPITQDENGSMTIKITKKEYDDSIRSMETYRVLKYNPTLKSMITKDFYNETEMKIFSEYQVFNFYQHFKGLEIFMRGVFRAVGDQFAPDNGLSMAQLMRKWWFWAIIIVVLGALIYFSWPTISKALGGAVSSSSSALSGVNKVVQPAP